MAERKVIKSFRDRTSDGQRFHVGELYEGEQERLDELSALGFLEAVEEEPTDPDKDKEPDQVSEVVEVDPQQEQAPEEEKPKAKRGRQKKDGDDA
ncbi:hypothetical protein L479_02353 [Exiguobacterium sp. S17]|nr:hypothetical protein L479_02353 [Exiguobacterium sp. S17]